MTICAIPPGFHLGLFPTMGLPQITRLWLTKIKQTPYQGNYLVLALSGLGPRATTSSLRLVVALHLSHGTPFLPTKRRYKNCLMGSHTRGFTTNLGSAA